MGDNDHSKDLDEAYARETDTESAKKRKKYMNFDDEGRNLAERGDDINLSNLDPGLRRIVLAAGWNNKTVEEDPLDLDISVFLLDKNDQTRVDEDFVFYNNHKGAEGAVQHSGDNRTGAGDGDDETIIIDLNGLSFDIARVAIVVSIYQGEEQGLDFDMVRNVFIRLVNEETGSELVHYSMDSDLHGHGKHSGFLAAFIDREGPYWHFRPVGETIPGGLGSIATRYGILVSAQ